jgi:endoglucanase
VDVLIDTWHANFFRLDLTSWASNQVSGTTVVQYKDVTQDASYLSDLKKLVDHIGTKPGVYVMLTLFSHPSQDDSELPTAATQAVYTKLAQTFLNSPHVLYGVTNEPHDASDSAVWTAMNTAVQTYRNEEPASGPHHIVAVQGTQSYARELSYYVTHPITAGSGVNVVYETHVYNPQADWQAMFITPSATIPVIIGEYGPDGTYMKTVADAQALQVKAEQLEIPYIGWSFSSQNVPAMLAGNDADECTKINWTITPTDWGNAIISRLANAW